MFFSSSRIAIIFLFAVLLVLLTACSDPDLQPKPNDTFWKIGLWGHGRGLLGDMRINYFGVQRRCDTCHIAAPEAHGNLGTCNRCHQPHIEGWSKALLSKEHDRVFQLEGNRYHGDLDCRDCHKNLQNQEEYTAVQCNHCHNHGHSDMDFAHELLDGYEYSTYANNKMCRSCHVKTGEKYRELYDLASGELL